GVGWLPEVRRLLFRSIAFIGTRFYTTIPRMFAHARGPALLVACLIAGVLAHRVSAQQPLPPASGARMLLLPRRIVSGERATLARSAEHTSELQSPDPL